MREQATVTKRNRRITSWFQWAARHPAAVLLGALVVAMVTIPQSPRTGDIERDESGEDVPLFI